MMNVAEQSNHASKRRRRRIALVVTVLVAGLTCSYLYAWERGPIYCNNGCLVQAPVIDPLTRQFLENQLAPIDGWVPLWMYATGTTYMVCNGTHCATYRQTFSGEYITDERIPIDPPPSHVPGGGNSSGVFFPGGSTPGGTGVVTVGPISHPPIEMEPCALGGAIRMVPKGGCDF